MDNPEYDTEELECILVNIENDEDTYPLHMFMRDEGTFHGIMGESNTSAIGVKLSDCGDGAKLWRVW